MSGAIQCGIFRRTLDVGTTFIVFAFLLAGCDRSAPKVTGPLRQRGYLWQRDWTPAVVDAVVTAQQRLDGIVLLGGEIEWIEKKPSLITTNIDWEMLRSRQIQCGLALRIAPLGVASGQGDSHTRFVVNAVKSLVDIAASQGVALSEFQIDFDCPQNNLAAYRAWLRALRQAVHPMRLVLTALPAWLDDPEFVLLVREADGFVLQVHSVPIANVNEGGNLCDAQLARTWVKKAARLGLPFSVALPTYRCSAGYDATGKLMSVAMDSVQPAWPPGTRVLEFATNADEMASLVKEWKQAQPPQLREVIWYRLPVATDIRNWRWTTLSAVMSGRKPLHHLEVIQEGENPIDLSILNAGEADEELDSVVTATWDSGAIVAADALAGWTVDVTNGHATFRKAAQHQMRLSPGGKRQIGWLRYEQPARLQLELAKKE